MFYICSVLGSSVRVWVMAAEREDKVSRKDRAELVADERRLLALEDIADELHLIRGYFADVSLWVAHIGRNMPVGRGRP